MKSNQGAQRLHGKRAAAAAATTELPPRRRPAPDSGSDSEGSEPDRLAIPGKRARNSAVQQARSDDTADVHSGYSQSDSEDDSGSQVGLARRSATLAPAAVSHEGARARVTCCSHLV
jgi:hypothetical protein